MDRIGAAAVHGPASGATHSRICSESTGTLSHLHSKLFFVTSTTNGRDAHQQAVDLARQLTRRAVLEIVRETGGQVTTRPMFRARPELDVTVTDADPMAGLRAAAMIRFAVRRLSLEYTRQAREDGHSWQEIGITLGLENLAESGISMADAAYDLATGDASYARRSFAWVCPACAGTVIDRGPAAGSPADCEDGHADGCRRLATAITALDASWDDDGEAP